METYNGTAKSLQHAVGYSIQVTLKTDKNKPLTGILFTADGVSELLVLQTPGTTGGTWNVQIFPTQSIEHVKVMSDQKEDAALALPKVSTEELVRSEQKTQDMAVQALAKIGQNVSSAAQDLFDTLAKTMPCAWENQNIRVMDEVLISPPYTLTDCCSSTNEALLSRVKKVMEGEKRRMLGQISS